MAKEHGQNLSPHLLCGWVSLCGTQPRQLCVVIRALVLVLLLQVSNNRSKWLLHTRILQLFGNSYCISFAISFLWIRHFRFLQLFPFINVFKSLHLPIGFVWNILPFIYIFLQVHTKPNTAVLQDGFIKVEWSGVLIIPLVLQHYVLLLN